MSSSQYPIVPDGNKYLILPPFSIRHYEVFNESNTYLLVYDNLAILTRVVGPGGYCAYNCNYPAMTAKTAIPTTGKATITVSDTHGATQPAPAPGYNASSVINAFIGEVFSGIDVNQHTNPLTGNFIGNVSAGNTIAVCVGFTTSGAPSSAPVVTDSQGNPYTLYQTTPTVTSGGLSYTAYIFASTNCKLVSKADTYSVTHISGAVSAIGLNFASVTTLDDVGAVDSQSPASFAFSAGPTGAVSAQSEFFVSVVFGPTNSTNTIGNTGLWIVGPYISQQFFSLLATAYQTPSNYSGTVSIAGSVPYAAANPVTVGIQTFYGAQVGQLDPK